MLAKNGKALAPCLAKLIGLVWEKQCINEDRPELMILAIY